MLSQPVSDVILDATKPQPWYNIAAILFIYLTLHNVHYTIHDMVEVWDKMYWNNHFNPVILAISYNAYNITIYGGKQGQIQD